MQLAEHLDETLPTNRRNRTGRINKSARNRFRYHYPRSASITPGALANQLPGGVMAEPTVNRNLILTPLLLIYDHKTIAHSKKRVLTHRPSGARLCGPAKRLHLLHIAAALNGLGLDWNRGRDVVQKQAAKLPTEIKLWLREIDAIGKESRGR